jgi:hypothetical protein
MPFTHPAKPLPDLVTDLERHTKLLLRALRVSDPHYLEHLQNRQYCLEGIRDWSRLARQAPVHPELLARLASCVEAGREVLMEGERFQADARSQFNALSQQLNLAKALALQTESNYAALDVKA